MERLQTIYQQRKIARDEKIYRDYIELIERGAAKTVAHSILCERYMIGSVGTLYRIINRVSERLNVAQ